MKKISNAIFAGALALLLASCTSSGSTYTLQGIIADLDGTVYVVDEDGAVVSSAAVNEGSFIFKNLPYEKPGYYSVTDNTEGTPKFRANFFVEPGTLTVEDDAAARVKQVSGTPANDALIAMNAERAVLLAEYYDDNTTASRKAEIDQEDDELLVKYLRKNYDNYFGMYLLSQQAYYYSGQELIEELASFSEELQNTKIGAKLMETAQKRVITDVGQHYLEVVQNDPDGNPITLSSVVENPANKYVLLDFWASWCGPCMNEVPYLVQTYKEFHKKGFEIYGVSFDTDAENWKAAIKEKELSWVHVSDVNRFDNQAARDYTIQAIPSNVLIDTETGTVIAKNLRGEAVYQTIANLLGK